MAVCLVLGILITVAEPDLQVLANQVPAIPNLTLILTVVIGVGIFLVLAQARMLFNIPLSYALVFFYILIFILTCFAPDDFIPVSFDSGGVTTGPITVPFVMALGIGMASVRSDKNSNNDSFGLISLLQYRSRSGSIVTRDFLHGFPVYAKEVFTAICPIIVLFAFFQLVFKRFQKHQLIKISSGMVYTYIGLVLFLTGVNIGFMPAGQFTGETIAGNGKKWFLIPIGMVIGYFIVKAEPSVQVLTKQVEEVSNGSITQKSIKQGLSVGIALSAGIAMLRILTGISIMWFLIPGYTLSLIMTFFVPQIFTGIAFDSGGVASGPMTATFLLPLAMGACEAVGGNILTDAFGIVAMVAMTPLVTIQILGLADKIKERVLKKRVIMEIENVAEDTILYFD